MIDLTGFEEKLENLTGLDYEAAEKRCRAVNDLTPVISLSSRFQIELASLALEINAHEIKALPLKQYSRILNTVQGFLFSATSDEETVARKSDAQ